MSMSRYRIQYPGAYYHVIQRGNNRENIFQSDEDKGLLLQKVEELKEGLNFELLGYVIMDNHYHLLLQTKEEPLSKIMHRLNNYYSRSFNKRYRRSGHVFGGRYKASLIQDDGYLLGVLRYVHWNPVKAGICHCANDYQWSSDHCYRRNKPGLVDIDFILNILVIDRQKAIKEYVQIMRIDDAMNYEEASIIGDESFTELIKHPKEEAQRKDLDHILRETGLSVADFKLVKMGSRKRRLVPYKEIYVQAALKQQYTFKEIGQNIGISDAAVHKLHNKSFN